MAGANAGVLEARIVEAGHSNGKRREVDSSTWNRPCQTFSEPWIPLVVAS